MKKFTPFFTLLFLMFVTNIHAVPNSGMNDNTQPGEAAGPDNLLPVTVACDWCIVLADASGGFGGGDIGIKIGLGLGGPAGGAVGGIVGGLIGGGLASYCASQSMVIPQGPIVIGPGPYNPFDNVGDLHNQLLREYSRQGISPVDFEGLYRVSVAFLSPRYSFDYTNTAFKAGMRDIFDKTRLNLGNNQSLLSSLVTSSIARDKLSAYVAAAQTATSLSAFNEVALALESSTLNGSGELSQYDLENLQKALAIARYSINFWNPWQ